RNIYRLLDDLVVQQTTKRSSYLDWEEYFMATAFLAAKRSKDPVTQVGACIVNEDKHIVGIGYNGMPRGCSDDDFEWGRGENNRLESKYLYAYHAETNAILNKNSANVKNCTLYVMLFPCSECAKLIIQSGITKVVHVSDKDNGHAFYEASEKMLLAAGVTIEKYTRERQNVVIDFTKIDRIQHEESAGTSKRTSETADVETK
ncbi:hypothetical protein AMK59_2303, partial [Oryctes borbonicus]